ncbi:MAG: outer membrane lipoprotein carrier protein LolA [Candidatus Binatus sp.]|uniref:LolA family protein n=1 Tax=Candidatus Binatus sp. TaxID=2811406 RepID=UPI0027166325|nr:outer membrane lipoprotein carrier protein LolA [Candidatus Binatus sp.]MDO8434531.1 outer membrane lipoprotein carrier protein LolA [Candidatus Binatus sp.]
MKINALKWGVFEAAMVLMVAMGSARADGTVAMKTPVSHELRQVLDRLQKHYRDTNSFSAKFNEEIATVGAPKRNRAGAVSFRKPGRMRWDFIEPEKQTIVSDGEMLFSYDPDLNQVVQTPLKSALKSSSATSFLLGMGNIDHDFSAEFASPPKPGDLIHLKLNAKAGGYRIEIGLDPKSYDLVTLTLTDQLGDVTAVRFSDIRSNVRISEDQFAFKAPAGADIVTAPSSTAPDAPDNDD